MAAFSASANLWKIQHVHVQSQEPSVGDLVTLEDIYCVYLLCQYCCNHKIQLYQLLTVERTIQW